MARTWSPSRVGKNWNGTRPEPMRPTATIKLAIAQARVSHFQRTANRTDGW